MTSSSSSSRPQPTMSTSSTTIQILLQMLLAVSCVVQLLILPSSCVTAASVVASSSSSSSSYSFHQDVLQWNNPTPTVQTQTRASPLVPNTKNNNNKAQKQQQQQQQIHSALLQKAMLRKDFEAKYGVSLDSDGDGAPPVLQQNNDMNNHNNNRKLEESEDNSQDGNDDYYMNDNNMYSFSGYSMKFAKCQPVQYFSEYAMAAGQQYSPMITDDIVILRLCPTASCKSSSSSSSSTDSSSKSSNEYGCQYNFAEYAIELSDYVRIMLRYSSQKRDYMCTYCASCLNGGNANAGRRLSRRRHNHNRRRRRLEDEPEQDGEQQQEEQQQQQGNNNGADDYYRADDDYVVAAAAAADDDNAAADDYYKNACSTWSTYCTDYAALCFLDNDEDNNNNNNQYSSSSSSYLDYDDYLDYLDCAQVKYNDYAYYVRPRCDGYQGTIKMAVYYDQYCVQYAGNEVSLKNLGLGFRESAFTDFYSGTCLDCSESEYPPYDASSTLCNRLHHDSAKCTDDMVYDLFGGTETSHETECSYIEALRFGTYNELGQLSTRNQDGSLVEKVTSSQKVMLVIPIFLCIALVIYACYLHHAMTNLLIKSLSHRELLPPSRHAQAAARRNSPRGRGNNNNNNNGGGSSRRGMKGNNNSSKGGAGDPDWDIDDNNEGEYA